MTGSGKGSVIERRWTVDSHRSLTLLTGARRRRRRMTIPQLLPWIGGLVQIRGRLLADRLAQRRDGGVPDCRIRRRCDAAVGRACGLREAWDATTATRVGWLTAAADACDKSGAGDRQLAHPRHRQAETRCDLRSEARRPVPARLRGAGAASQRRGPAARLDGDRARAASASRFGCPMASSAPSRRSMGRPIC